MLEFDRRLKELARFTPVTGALIAVNVIVWIATITGGVNWLDPTAESLRAWGANYGPLTSHGDGWRLLTCCFLHAGIVHLLVNQWALWQFGSWLERLFGHVGFALLFLISGFASSVIAVRWQPDAVLTGSTGAIAGLIGALAAFCLRVPGVAPSQALSRLRVPAFVFLGYNVGVDLYRQRLDAAGFIGGLVLGFIGGLILAQPIGAEGRPRRLSRNTMLAAIGLVMGVFTPFWIRPDLATELEQIQTTQREVVAQYQQAQEQFANDRMSAERFVDLIVTEVLPHWRETEHRFRALENLSLSNEARRRHDKLLEAMKLREQAWGLMADSLREGSEEGMETARDKAAAADRIEEEVIAESEKAPVE